MPDREYRLELARRITKSERTYAGLAENAWEAFDVTTAVRYRGRAEGLEMAREHMLEIAAAERGDGPAEPSPEDRAWFTVWLHANWRFLTSKMTTEEREAAADAVERYDQHMSRVDNERPAGLSGVRWWAE